MKREIIKTADGSSTIFLPEWNEHYHSKHGALQEAMHVFIRSGLYHYIAQKKPDEIAILEIGFGTGLNALVTFFEVEKMQLFTNYVGVEAFPVSNEEWQELDYSSLFENKSASEIFEAIHQAEWERSVEISPLFELKKEKKDFHEVNDKDQFDLVFFDAFGPRVQPELWTEEIFFKMFHALTDYGILVTYSANGRVRRAMQAVGFTVEKIPGPPGKREMLRATKLPGGC